MSVVVVSAQLIRCAAGPAQVKEKLVTTGSSPAEKLIAAALAVMAYGIADLPQPLPR